MKREREVSFDEICRAFGVPKEMLEDETFKRKYKEQFISFTENSILQGEGEKRPAGLIATLQDMRCTKCNKLLGKIAGTAEIICPRCKTHNQLRGDTKDVHSTGNNTGANT